MSETPGRQTSARHGADTSEAKRVNVVFSAEQYDMLQNLARMQNISLSDALRQAINISDLIVHANADKNTEILIKKGNAFQELKIIR